MLSFKARKVNAEANHWLTSGNRAALTSIQITNLFSGIEEQLSNELEILMDYYNMNQLRSNPGKIKFIFSNRGIRKHEENGRNGHTSSQNIGSSTLFFYV